MSGDNSWIAWVMIFGFFPAAAGISTLTSWLWFRDGNRVQEWIDYQISASTIRKVERYLDHHPTREDQS